MSMAKWLELKATFLFYSLERETFHTIYSCVTRVRQESESVASD